MEKTYIREIMKQDGITRFSILGVEDIPGKAFEIFAALAKNNTSVDIILQTTDKNNKKDIDFTVAEEKTDAVLNILNQKFGERYKIEFTRNVSKISIVGSGMIHHPGIAAMVFEAVYDLNVDIQMVSTSEMHISLIVNKNDAVCAVDKLREKFNIPLIVDSVV